MNRLVYCFAFIFLIAIGTTGFTADRSLIKNNIAGRVIDSKTQEGLPGVNIVVNEIPGKGATSDTRGYFSINVPNGSYSVKATLVGYTPVVKTDVIVTSGSDAHVMIEMAEATVEMGQVIVKADYFDRAVRDNDLSTVILGAEEIRRSPGSAQDFQRILQAMAGVSFSNDQTNELLVRGGAPHENLTVYDNMEVHSTNHYPNEHNSGGPINMVNVDLIEDIQFSTGGFISKYGDKLSSVMNITTREGTRNNLFDGNVNLSMAGYGTVMEGRINEGQGSWIFSARNSFLNLVAGSFGLTAIPKYHDMQFKLAYDLSTKHKLSFSGIYGNDKIDIEGEPEVSNSAMANQADTIGVEQVYVKQSQYVVGTNLKSLWSRNFYSILTVYLNNYHYDVSVNEDFTKRYYDAQGEVYSWNTLKKRPIFSDVHDNHTLAVKTEFVWNPVKYQEITLGGYAATGDFKQDLYILGDSSRYFVNGQWTPAIAVPASRLNYRIDLFDNYKYYAYVNDKVKMFDERLLVNLGLRYDYFTYSRKGNVSPRFSASYFLIPAITSINVAYGDYFQTQSFPTYGDREHKDINRYLKNTHSRHYVAGIEQILDEGLKLTVEGYYKQYDNIPEREEYIHFTDRTFRSNRNLTVGKQTVYGIDFMMQQKLVKSYYGTISYSRTWSRDEDPRIGYEGKDYPSDYEFPHVLNIIVGKRFSSLRSELDRMPFFIKYPSYMLPFSDDMEISLRWRYASGKPYTPRQWSTREQSYEGETRWSSGVWVPTDEINSARYPDYHRLDLAFSSRYNFNGWNLSVFLSIQNLYNRKNIAAYQYNSDGTIDTVYQFSILPVGGIELEF